ncbi:MAG: UDP-glucose 4-epimerase GalE [Acidimicrobiia bacterium]
MTVLVTGGAGYIGSHTVRALRARDVPVVVLDSLELGHTEAVLDAPIEVGDIADAALVTRVVQQYGVDAVVHFAGYKAAGESMEMPERYFDNNVARTAVLLDALRTAGVSNFVFSSSCSVYGTPSVLPVDESHPTGPESPYAESKLAVERMLRWYDDCHGFRSVSLRYFNAAGASFDARIGEDSPKPLNLVPLAMLAALGKIPKLSVFGTDYDTPDGSCIRDYIHVDDLADAHVRALDYLRAGGDTTSLNVGTGIGSTVLEVIDGTKRVTGIDFPVELVGRRAGDPSAVWADNTRVRDVLGWNATHGIDAILASAWAWHSSHPDGYATR